MTSPRIGVMLPRDLPAARVLDFARETERLGFAELWVVEDLGFRGGIAQAAAALAVTERLTVGIGILPAAARSVSFAAMEVATLAQLFPGRIDVGLGHGMPGWMRSAGAWPERPLTFLRAFTASITALLHGRDVPADGLVAAPLEPTSLPDQVPPLLLGVRGPRSLALAGEVADGTILAEPCAPEYAALSLQRIAAPGPHRLVAYNVGAVDDDATTAVERARPALAWIGEPDWAPHLEPLPFGQDLAALRADCATREEFTRRLPQEWVTQLALAGTPDDVRARIGALGAAGVTSSVFIPAGDDPFRALDQLARVL